MSNILKITEMLLKRYDEKYETYKTNNLKDNINISSGDRYDFKKLILELRKTGLNKKITDNDIEEIDIEEIDCEKLYNNNPNPPTNLTKINFVQDIVLAQQIVIFRKLEIKKQIAIIYHLIESFKLAAFQLLKYEEKNANQLNPAKHITLIKNKFIITQMLNKLLSNADELNKFFKKTICRYASLEENLELLLKNNTQ